VADLGFGAVLDAPAEPLQAVFAVVVGTGVDDGLGDQVAQVRDGCLGEQRRV